MALKIDLDLMSPSEPRISTKEENKLRGMIYKITNLENGQTYIGATTHSMRTRFKQHKRRAYKRRSPLARAIDEAPRGTFSIQHIATAVVLEHLAELETLMIEQEQPFYNSALPDQNAWWPHA